ncbi:Beta-barrel assembly-enhancing protease [Kordia antarctica]|uniref:Beta-barrel assembly-enhancing protease n=2 Tax=Kordia antarctica TaxID=1218801 RepID=A0A7L4ZLB9_9FLAO|nr:Beta-barrel assembly-enhancing protease [Kordia antarctica]
MYIFIFSGMLFSIPEIVHAQEEESAEISLEENIDEFQEHFFEALKQRGIENYDRAIDELLKCKKIDDNASVSFELGKNYYSRKEYDLAKESFERAVTKKPQNQWFLLGLFNTQLKLNEREEALDTGKKIVSLNPKFREDVAKVYIGMREYKKALKELEKLEKNGGLSLMAANMKNMLEKQLHKNQNSSGDVAEVINQTPKPRADANSKILEQIEEALETDAFTDAIRLVKIGLGDFPSQPKLYLYNAKALNALKEYKKAIEMLEIGLDYIIEDTKLEKEFYQAFVVAYKKMGNSKKENYYRKKIQ